MKAKVENEFYNEEVKLEYLSTIENEATRKVSEFVLRKTRVEEERLNKDLYEMTNNELKGTLSDFKCSTSRAAYTSIVKIEEYLMWSARQGYRRTNISPFPQHGKEEWGKQFVASYMNYAFTREQIEEMANNLVNEVDRALLLLLFEGASGKRYSEVLNLKWEDVYFENDNYYAILFEEDDNSKRTIEITPYLYKMLELADKQKLYVNKNGESEAESRYYYSEFEDSKYIFKRLRRGKQGGKIDNFYVNRKMAMFKEVFQHRYLKASHLSNSGIMYMAHQAMQEEGIITSKRTNKIAEQYNTSFTSDASGGKYRNVTIIKRIVMSKDFEELYGYKAKFDF